MRSRFATKSAIPGDSRGSFITATFNCASSYWDTGFLAGRGQGSLEYSPASPQRFKGSLGSLGAAGSGLALFKASPLKDKAGDKVIPAILHSSIDVRTHRQEVLKNR